MRFMARGLFGLVLLVTTLGILGIAAKTFVSSVQEMREKNNRPRVARERVFAVDVRVLEFGAHAPEIATFGEIISGQTLELRAAASGAIVRLSPSFREGANVKKGALLFQTDPALARSKLLLAENQLEEAQSDLVDAQSEFLLSQEDEKAANKQLLLREQALERQISLRERGVGTEASVETAALSAASAEQALVSKRMARSQHQSRITRAEIAVSRTEINFDEATRVFDDTTVVAEFDGVLSEVSAVLGGLVNANEKLGSLINPNALEVSFRISNQQYGNLIENSSGLTGTEVSVYFAEFDSPLSGVVERVGAAVGEGQTGRELFAKLDNRSAEVVRPGDFVSVRIKEPVMQGVAVIPATAASSDGEVLLVDDGDRLLSGKVTILRKQGDDLVVRAPDLAGARLVLLRAPQLGEGIRVEPRAPGNDAMIELETVELSAERRALFIAKITESSFIPEKRKTAILEKLNQEKVPAALIKRLENRMGITPVEPAQNVSEASDETTEITEDMRAKLIAFVENSDNMPADRKEVVLQSLKQDKPSKLIVERITQRMGS